MSIIKPNNNTISAITALPSGMVSAPGLSTGSLVLISNTALSSAGSLDISGVFSSTYANYRIIGSGLNMANDNNAWVFQLRTDSAVTNTSYWWAGVGQRDTGGAVDDGETDTTDWRIIGNCANTGQALNFDMTVYRPNLGLYTSYTCIAGGRRSGGGGQVLNCGGYQNTTTQFTGFRILVDSGNISAGNISVYGIKDS
jgi:hypothetical protein